MTGDAALDNMKAVVTFSGGQDSTTVLAHVVHSYGADKVYALTANYGQRHEAEIDAARRVCELMGVRNHEVVQLGKVLHGTSPLTSADHQLETYSSPEEMEKIIGNRREATFVPMRNPLFLCVAANRAAVLGAKTVFTGICQMDNANYDDCRSNFLNSFENMVSFALGSDHRKEVESVWFEAPLMHKSKAESVIWALEIRGAYVALGYSHTAYSGEYPPVTQDHATVLRAAGFAEAGVPDPLILRAAYEGLMKLPEESHYQKVAHILTMNKERNDGNVDMLNSVLRLLRDEHEIADPKPDSEAGKPKENG